MSDEPQADGLAQVRRRNPAWVIVCNPDGWCTARRDFWGSQQIITAPTLDELQVRLQALQQDSLDSPPS